ncbi:hypothetical protein EVAR_26722_1 [Eumeta japonica]|uniref:Uncharacterized protein n=1 Tax=Eumeta variegata TaxID=151549 RepID=A0A4C1XB56_EUMVA|nr:hypothetical protein EVAR_26722_1 [Eumeta japonica]
MRIGSGYVAQKYTASDKSHLRGDYLNIWDKRCHWVILVCDTNIVEHVTHPVQCPNRGNERNGVCPHVCARSAAFSLTPNSGAFGARRHGSDGKPNMWCNSTSASYYGY